MIIVRIKAGLGNQLFQYAAGKNLAHHHQCPLKLDITSFANDRLRRYGLSAFNIHEDFACDKDLRMVLGVPEAKASRILFRIIERLKPRYRRRILEDVALGQYDGRILRTPQHVYLNGYWQSEKYFSGIQDTLRHELTFKHDYKGCRAILESILNSAASVSLHIRRSDYVNDPETAMRYHACDLDYYANAAACLEGRLGRDHLHFYVFSDDMSWARSNLHWPYRTTFVSHDGDTADSDDLRLMSCCSHHVIANSSFSWWGAWLNPKPDKIVVAPNRYFKSNTATMRDWSPDNWIRM